MIRHPVDYLETLWQKPESTRKKILIVSVALISGTIIAAWFMTLSVPSIAPISQNAAPVRNLWESLGKFAPNPPPHEGALLPTNQPSTTATNSSNNKNDEAEQ